jgi:hypothetical protein
MSERSRMVGLYRAGENTTFRTRGARRFLLYHTGSHGLLASMIPKPVGRVGRCIVCFKPLKQSNPNKRKTVNTHDGNCRRLYHNYRMSVIRGNARLARKHLEIWVLTRRKQRATKKASTGRSASLVSKGRPTPVSPRILKKDSGALL